MDDFLKGALLVLMIRCIVSPVDGCPGSVDDILVLVAGLAVRRRWMIREKPV